MQQELQESHEQVLHEQSQLQGVQVQESHEQLLQEQSHWQGVQVQLLQLQQLQQLLEVLSSVDSLRTANRLESARMKPDEHRDDARYE